MLLPQNARFTQCWSLSGWTIQKIRAEDDATVTDHSSSHSRASRSPRSVAPSGAPSGPSGPSGATEDP